MDEIEPALGRDPGIADLMAERRLKMFAEPDPVFLHVPFPDHVVGRAGDDAEAFFHLVQRAFRPLQAGVFLGVAQRAADGGDEPAWSLL